MRLTAALLGLIVSAGCARTQGNVLSSRDGGVCNGLPCNGCCRSDGICDVGNSNAFCGGHGQACVACGATQVCQAASCVDGDAGPPPPDAGPILCRPCLTTADCGPNGLCVQYANSDYCGVPCNAELDCPTGQACKATLTFSGNGVAVCTPLNGSCGVGGCACPGGATCDVITGLCTPPNDGGMMGTDAGLCGPLVGPTLSSCCHSCVPGTGDCQPNGCYDGWWCNTSGMTCRCNSPPTQCGDAGTVDAGTFDGGALVGSVGPDGGVVSRLYFAVLGDTRPANPDDSPNYPTAVITRIYEEISDLQPPVQFVISTGDYVFATPDGGEGLVQMELYQLAASTYRTGPIFGLMGNQECTGSTTDNCPVGTTGNGNFDAFNAAWVIPFGFAAPYYVVPIDALDGTWSAKLIVLACNAWDPTQKAFLTSALAQPTTFTFIARHEPLGNADAPCIADSDPLITGAYTQLFAGHDHLYAHDPGTRMTITGNAGAPTAGLIGFVTVEQQPGIGFKVTAFDFSTGLPTEVWYF